MNILKTIKKLPPRRAQVEAAHGSVPVLKGKAPEPYIRLEPKDRFLDQLQREMLPSDVKHTLQGALSGDLHRQGVLFDSMMDSWYRLQSNIDEVQTKVSKAPLIVKPFSEDGEKPSDSALEKAQLVEKLLKGMKANPVTGEQGLEGLIRDIALGYYTGHAVNEIYWERGSYRKSSCGVSPQSVPSASSRMVRASDEEDKGAVSAARSDCSSHSSLAEAGREKGGCAGLGLCNAHAVECHRDGLTQDASATITAPCSNRNVPWRFFAYPSNGEEQDRLMLAPEGYYGQKLEDFPAHKFIIAVKRGHGGHATQSAPLRVLTSYWLAATYGLKWLLGFAQIYGIPLRMANYADGTGNLQKVCEMLENMGSQSWGAFPEGTKIDVVDAAKSAGDLPQKLLIENADKACDIFILGQTLTTDVSDSGSRALGDVHAEVRMDKLQAVADFVAEAISTQLVKSIIELNYGNIDEMPCVKIEFPRPKDELKLVERDIKLHKEMGLNIALDDLYERHGVKRPAEGEELFMVKE